MHQCYLTNLYPCFTCWCVYSVPQCPTRALFQLSRRDREYLSFNLVSETGSRISFFQSHASRRDRDFLSFNLVLRDEHENFFLSISCFETSTRIFPPNLRLRDESEKFCHLVSVFETRTGFWGMKKSTLGFFFATPTSPGDSLPLFSACATLSCFFLVGWKWKWSTWGSNLC